MVQSLALSVSFEARPSNHGRSASLPFNSRPPFGDQHAFPTFCDHAHLAHNAPGFTPHNVAQLCFEMMDVLGSDQEYSREQGEGWSSLHSRSRVWGFCSDSSLEDVGLVLAGVRDGAYTTIFVEKEIRFAFSRRSGLGSGEGTMQARSTVSRKPQRLTERRNQTLKERKKETDACLFFPFLQSRHSSAVVDAAFADTVALLSIRRCVPHSQEGVVLRCLHLKALCITARIFCAAHFCSSAAVQPH